MSRRSRIPLHYALLVVLAGGCARATEPAERLVPETEETSASAPATTAAPTATSEATSSSPLGVNVAAGRPVIDRGGGVSYADWGNANDAVDYNTTTNPDGGRWGNQTNYGTFQVVDLGTTYLLHGVGYTLDWDGAYVNPLTFVVEVSTDGQTWKEVSRVVHPYSATEGSNQVDNDIPLAAVEARYVRYSEPDDGAWNGWGDIFHLRAFALAVARVSATAPSVSPLPPTTSPIPLVPVMTVRPTEDEVWSVPSLWNYFDLASGLSLTVPGTREFTAVLDVNSPLTWPFFWCATDPERLAENLSEMSVQFSIDGIVVPAEDILELETETDEWTCHYWATLLTDWQNGSQTSLRVEYSLGQQVNDGQRDFPAGDYAYVVLVDLSY